MNINIGADEIILWLRKNGRCANVTQLELGKKIANYMDNTLHAIRGKKSDESMWYKDMTELTKSAQQYSINENQLPLLFNEINSW